ncbi:uncharacterized protein LOC34622694 [Cyclospora cayetanensis]|uniref:Uncharacterized protein LOC34622694 n=1 Tax=Cyclospora cayetanensis TaxID=88456 RepID=A0A6P6S3B1_9EIME|nr:uncharacterized protein LOC34622694 [Cyclospora cayetanensis]
MAICCRSVSRLALRIQPFCAARSDTAPWTPSRCIPSRSAAHNRRSSAERLLPQRQQHCCSSIRWTGSFAAHVASQHREYLVAKETAWCWKKSHTATASAARFTTSTVSAKAGRELLLDEPQRLVLERVAQLLQQPKNAHKHHAVLEGLLPPALMMALTRFLALRDDAKTLRALLMEQQQQQNPSSNATCSLEEGEDVDLLDLQLQEGAVVAEISDLLLQHAEVLAAVAEGRTSARNKHKRSEASTDEAMLEVLAGVGGEEAAQFASELFGMYGALAERQGWRFDVLERNKSAEGCGLKNAKALVSGHGVGVLLVLEAGVHRVQRVPSTDAKRRLQTSTAAVTVLPCVSEVEVDMSPSSLRIESMRASGPGGQSVNKSETAVRVTHLPTGLSVCMKDTSSQVENRQRALLLLRHLLQQRVQQQQRQELHAAAGAQMGGKYRSEKIRTYNFPSDCVRDHRISQHVANVREFLGSADGLPQLLNELYMQHQKVVLNETLQAIQSIVEQR